jgi:hypothetical protein
VKFEQLGEAIAALGTSLGQSLGLYICLSCWSNSEFIVSTFYL